MATKQEAERLLKRQFQAVLAHRFEPNAVGRHEDYCVDVDAVGMSDEEAMEAWVKKYLRDDVVVQNVRAVGMIDETTYEGERVRNFVARVRLVKRT